MKILVPNTNLKCRSKSRVVSDTPGLALSSFPRGKPQNSVTHFRGVNTSWALQCRHSTHMVAEHDVGVQSFLLVINMTAGWKMRPKLLKTLSRNSARISQFAPDYICNKFIIVGIVEFLLPKMAWKHTDLESTWKKSNKAAHPMEHGSNQHLGVRITEQHHN